MLERPGISCSLARACSCSSENRHLGRDCTEEAAFAAGVLASASIPVHDVHELGSGGGSNAVHLKAHFALTLVDLSEGMLEVSRRLNPECQHSRATCARCASVAPSTPCSSTTPSTT